MGSKKALKSTKAWAKRLPKYEERIRLSLDNLANIEQQTNLTIQQMREICDAVSRGEQKARRAKKKWLKPTYVWSFLLRKNILTEVYNSWI